MRFGESLQKLREQRGLSQSELAEKSGLPLRSIQNWEQKHREPRAQALLALARALGVSVETLIVGSVPKRKWERAEAEVQGMRDSTTADGRPRS